MLTRLLTAKDDRLRAAQTRAPRAAVVPPRPRARAARRHAPGAARASSARSRSRPTPTARPRARRALVELAARRRRSGAPRGRRRSPRRDRRTRPARWPISSRGPTSCAARTRSTPRARALELAVACGHTPDVHQSAFLQINKPYQMRDDEPYKRALDRRSRRCSSPRTTRSPRSPPTLAEAAALMWPDLEEALARAGCDGRQAHAGHARTRPRSRCSRA